MIEMELENESVILKCQTINAQPAFGKPAAPGANVQSSDSNDSLSSACQAVARNKKLLGTKRSASAEATA